MAMRYPYLEIIGEINRTIGTVSVASRYPIRRYILMNYTRSWWKSRVLHFGSVGKVNLKRGY